MRWPPWRHREPDGEHARATQAAADRHLDDTREQSRRVAEATRAAAALARQVDRFARELDRSMWLRGI